MDLRWGEHPGPLAKDQSVCWHATRMGGQQISARGTALGKHTVDTKAKGHTPTSDPRPSKSGIFHLLKGPPKSLQKNAYYEYKLYMNLIPLHQNKLFFKLPIFLTNFLRYPPMLTFVVPK